MAESPRTPRRASSASRQQQRSDAYSEDYINMLLNLCKFTKPTFEDVRRILNELHNILGDPRPNRIARATAASAQASSSPTSTATGSPSRSSEGGRTCRKGEGDDVPYGGGEEGSAYPCAWTPHKSCWLKGEIPAWNAELAKGCFELHPDRCGEFAISGYAWDKAVPPTKLDLLRTSLVVHLLVRQHRCVRRVVVDFELGRIEQGLLWNAVETGVAALTRLDCIESKELQSEFLLRPTSAICCLRFLGFLYFERVRFNSEAATALSGFLTTTETLETLVLKNVEVPDENDANALMESLASNKTLKKLIVSGALLQIRDGHAFADILAKTSFEHLEVEGGGLFTASSLVAGAVVSPNLKSLKLSQCSLYKAIKETLSKALTQKPLADAFRDLSLEKPACRLESLELNGLYGYQDTLQQAYASLIGGVLIHLKITDCQLSKVFATLAAQALRRDARLVTLDLRRNPIDVQGFEQIIAAMTEDNKTLLKLAIDVKAQGHVDAMRMKNAYDMIEKFNLSSRLELRWEDPDAEIFSRGDELCKSSTARLTVERADIAARLEVVANSRKIREARIDCGYVASATTIAILNDFPPAVRFLRDLHLSIEQPEQVWADVLESLKGQRSIRKLKLSNFVCESSAAKPLQELVEHNPRLNALTISHRGDDPAFVCAKLKEVVKYSRYLVELRVERDHVNYANDYGTKSILRNNMLFVHVGVRFVLGSCNWRHAWAFENVHHTESLRMVLTRDFTHDYDKTLELVDRARKRLPYEYFIITRIVNKRVTCVPSDKCTLDMLDVDLLARVCSFLKVNDVKFV
ncbi:hypothetical protein HPB50_010392 [Hyalomma asiaticum]|uniref:Uncharacterized protein n=1 Tax=Hyalomma asiaticum TaxID=266040 RepID=A0ACB7RJ71_HYAAI|nr:hypothetical protein HPB50_010392 [Hyalomma asiaticum]